MKSKAVVETATDDIATGYMTEGKDWISLTDDEADEVFESKDGKLLAQIIRNLVADIRDRVSEDLRDIWARLDTLEGL